MTLRALDLFCKAGGATRGLQLAGFAVTGVDIAEQPRYVGDRFVRADVTRIRMMVEPDRIAAAGYSFVWASPPCQSFTAYRRRDPSRVGAAALNLIPFVRDALRRSGVPYVIENVPGAPLENPITLCGSMFGLDVRRHRLFESSFPIVPPACRHHEQRGSFPQATNRANRRRTVEVGVYRIPLAVQRAAMGIDWMRLDELSEAIPPAYSAFIARAFLASLEVP